MKLMDIDARGWVGLSVFGLTVMVLWMVAAFPELREDEFFKVLATAIVLTGFVQGVVGWAYTATKQGGELAERNQTIVEKTAAVPTETPQQVEVVNAPDAPVPTTDGAPAASEELPDYAQP